MNGKKANVGRVLPLLSTLITDFADTLSLTLPLYPSLNLKTSTNNTSGEAMAKTVSALSTDNNWDEASYTFEYTYLHAMTVLLTDIPNFFFADGICID